MELETQTTQNPLRPQQVAPSPPITPLPTKPKNWLMILLVLIVFLSLGAAGFFAYRYLQLKNQVSQAKPTPSPTPNPTASWKTYTNSASGYTLKYPSAWQVIESNQLLGSGEISDAKWNSSTTNDIPNIRITVYKSDSNFAKSITPGGIQAVVGGNTATKNTSEGKTFTTSYLIKNTSNTYLITLEAASKQESSKYEPLFTQILSTFTFIKNATPGNQIVLADNVYKCCVNIDQTYGDPAKFILNLPEKFKVLSTKNGASISLDGSTFGIYGHIGGSGGPCPMDNSDPSCGYNDEKFSGSFEILRIWKNKDGIFMLNPQNILIQGYVLNNITITKTAPNSVFSDQEINDWKSALKNIDITE